MTYNPVLLVQNQVISIKLWTSLHNNTPQFLNTITSKETNIYSTKSRIDPTNIIPNEIGVHSFTASDVVGEQSPAAFINAPRSGLIFWSETLRGVIMTNPLLAGSGDVIWIKTKVYNTTHWIVYK